MKRLTIAAVFMTLITGLGCHPYERYPQSYYCAPPPCGGGCQQSCGCAPVTQCAPVSQCTPTGAPLTPTTSYVPAPGTVVAPTGVYGSTTRPMLPAR